MTRRAAPDPPSNATIAERLEEIGHLLDEQGANPFRARAYVHAAEVVRGLDRPVTDLLATEGIPGLDALPGIGQGLAGAIQELATTGELALLDRLRGKSDPVRTLAGVPGLGPVLAERVHHELDVDTLPELEVAAHDGRLAALPGFGEKKVAAIRHYLAGRLARRQPPRPADVPVEELLDVDREYRQLALAGTLRLIAPRRFNPEGKAWLPVLHTQRAGRHYTALFSNTATAHRLGRTHDWVVLYVDDGRGERQHTVVTAHGGPLDQLRVVRGREAECQDWYAAREVIGPAPDAPAP